MLFEATAQELPIADQMDPKQSRLERFELEGALALALLGLVLLLRLATLNSNSLSLGEALSLATAGSNPLSELLFYSRPWFLQPPLFFVGLHLWVTVLGWSELALRLFPVALSVANLGLVYIVVRWRFGVRIALTSLLLLAFSPLNLYWSQTIRLAAWTDLLVTLSFGLALFAADKPRQNWRWLLYGLSALGLIYSSYLGLHALLGQAVFLGLLLYKERGALLRLGLTLALVALAFLPYLGSALEQLKAAGPVYSLNTGPAQIVEAIQNLTLYFGANWLLPLAGACFLSMYLLGLAWLWQNRRNLAWLVLCWGVLPLITSWLGGLFHSNFNPYENSFCLTPFLVTVAVGVWRLSVISRRRWSYLALVAILALDLITCLNYYRHYNTPDFRGAAAYIAQNRKDGDLLFLANGYGYTSWVVDYYLKMHGPASQIEHGSLPDVPTPQQLTDLVKNHPRIWLLSFDDGTNWAGKYVYPYLPATLKPAYSLSYGSIDQGRFTLTLYSATSP